ncbi:hypothetical protein K432DRAFT_380299 [Lepidopterella palustris CBS 459.81]|uniref:Uncharacterized protein n=1 Tax=Lepidopterella palustris CBS 459.81 TaxID=1314670 RepID=A0A8E2EEH8_9PEZI|nr:hypothetical protein K432DRAFT_380299 [Lepidopterella palustris CBS 459.81]
MSSRPSTNIILFQRFGFPFRPLLLIGRQLTQASPYLHSVSYSLEFSPPSKTSMSISFVGSLIIFASTTVYLKT